MYETLRFEVPMEAAMEDDLPHYLADKLVTIYEITWHHFSEYSNLHETHLSQSMEVQLWKYILSERQEVFSFCKQSILSQYTHIHDCYYQTYVDTSYAVVKQYNSAHMSDRVTFD